MATRIISDPARVWAYVHEQVPVPVVAGMKGLGLERDGELIAGVLYEGYNRVNVWMHVATTPGKKWTMEFLRYCFYYPFVELGCKRVSGSVESSNLAAIRFDEHLGFEREAVLRGAASDGGDVILYVMWRDKCRYLPEQYHGSLVG
jgi:RimJ/RimL family protein N-acetyltransferase